MKICIEICTERKNTSGWSRMKWDCSWFLVGIERTVWYHRFLGSSMDLSDASPCPETTPGLRAWGWSPWSHGNSRCQQWCVPWNRIVSHSFVGALGGGFFVFPELYCSLYRMLQILAAIMCNQYECNYGLEHVLTLWSGQTSVSLQN